MKSIYLWLVCSDYVVWMSSFNPIFVLDQEYVTLSNHYFTTWLSIMLLMFLSCRYLSCNSSLHILIWILICCRMIGLRVCGMNFHTTYEEFLVHCDWHTIWFEICYWHTICFEIGMSTRTLVVPMLWFLLIFWSRDVSTVKRLTWNNQDTRAQPLVLTTIALTRVSNNTLHV
jgi:hypothetical protein